MAMLPLNAFWCRTTACGAIEGEDQLEIVTGRAKTEAQDCKEAVVVKEAPAVSVMARDAAQQTPGDEESSEVSTAASSNTNPASRESAELASSTASTPRKIANPEIAEAPKVGEAVPEASKVLGPKVGEALPEASKPLERPCLAEAVIKSRSLSVSQRSASRRSQPTHRTDRSMSSAHPSVSAASSAIIDECATLPPPRVPKGLKPVTSELLVGTTIHAIRESLEAEEGPVQKFMREVLGCSDFNTTPWAASRKNLNKGSRQGLFFRKSRYRALLPTDIPGPVARLVGVPESVDAHSLFALSCSENELVLVQQSFVKGIMYSDRFRLQNTFCFTQEQGGCSLAQWAEVIWTKPLPWTHTPVKVFVEKKAKAEAKATFRDFARTISEAAS